MASEHELPNPRAAYTIREFCRAYRISDDFFYKLARQGTGPKTMRVGSRTLVSVAAAEEWRREREAAASAAMATTTD